MPQIDVQAWRKLVDALAPTNGTAMRLTRNELLMLLDAVEQRHILNLRQIARNLRESDQARVIQRVRDHWADLLEEAADAIDTIESDED